MLTLSILLEGLLAGVFLCSAMIEHAERTLAASEWIAYKQAKERVFGAVMPAFFGMTLVVAIVVAASSRFRISYVAIALLLVIALAITIVVHLPLNKAFQSWTPQSFPTHWDEQRRRWRDWNWIRCIFAVAAFATALAVRG